jgi:hypothetical protein
MRILRNGEPYDGLTDEEKRVLEKLAAEWKRFEVLSDSGSPLFTIVPASIDPWNPSLTREELDQIVRESPPPQAGRLLEVEGGPMNYSVDGPKNGAVSVGGHLGERR